MLGGCDRHTAAPSIFIHALQELRHDDLACSGSSLIPIYYTVRQWSKISLYHPSIPLPRRTACITSLSSLDLPRITSALTFGDFRASMDLCSYAVTGTDAIEEQMLP